MLVSNFSWIFGLLLSLLTLTSAGNVNVTVIAANPDQNLPEYRVITKPYWEIPITVNGPTVPQWGTIEQVYANMSSNYPGWSDRFPLSNSTVDSDDDGGNITIARSLYTEDSHFCFGPWQPCSRSVIKAGLDYLNKLSGQPRLDAGPGLCSRVSCSYKGAIMWCNDNHEEKWLDSFKDIAAGASVIYNKCIKGVKVKKTAGQIFYKDNWNVVVHYDSSDQC